MSPLPEELDAIAQLALLIDGDEPRRASMEQLVATAVSLVDGCDSASVTIVDATTVSTPAFTSVAVVMPSTGNGVGWPGSMVSAR